MREGYEQLIPILLALGAALVICVVMTPLVRIFAQKIGAIDDPGEARRIHTQPIPRLGGLAIFMGFTLSVVFFADITIQVQGILLGAIVVVITGAIDDVISLKASVKLIAQLLAAAIAIFHGVVIDIVMNPFLFIGYEHITLGVMSIPVTLIWIVAITNSVNFIDGLDGLAVGISAIDSVTMLIISLIVSDGNVAMIMAALAGACLGFLPYNLNPAKIFMGDTGALLLGYVLATVSVIGLFKFYALLSFAVPFLVLAVPLMDTAFAFFRRLLKGQNPMTPDRSHVHHKLLDLGLSQRNAVAILYSVNGALGLIAVVITTSGELKTLILIIGICIAALMGGFIIRSRMHMLIKSGQAPPEDIPNAAAPPGEEAHDGKD